MIVEKLSTIFPYLYLQFIHSPTLEVFVFWVLDTNGVNIPKGMASNTNTGEKGRLGTIHDIFRCIQLVQVHMEWLCGSEVDWAVTCISSIVKPAAPTSIVQTQECEQPICNLDLPSIHDCECK